MVYIYIYIYIYIHTHTHIFLGTSDINIKLFSMYMNLKFYFLTSSSTIFYSGIIDYIIF